MAAPVMEEKTLSLSRELDPPLQKEFLRRYNTLSSHFKTVGREQERCRARPLKCKFVLAVSKYTNKKQKSPALKNSKPKKRG
jgi:hypothetical protein